MPDLDEGSIKILYRNKVKVYFSSVKEAKKHNYTSYNPRVYHKPEGFIYGYTGLRGDAKDLYMALDKEKRVELIQSETIEDQGKYIEKADLVIWACGYQTNEIPLYDQKGEKIKLSTQEIVNGKSTCQYDANFKCKPIVEDAKGVVANTLVSGIAYP